MKTFFGRKFKKKKIKASVLAVTLIVLGMGIVIGLSAALVSIQQRRSSIGEGSSSRVFQSAESGVENAQKAMKEVSLAIGSGATVADLVSEIGSSSCDTATGLIEMGDNNYVELQRSDGSQISCASSTVSLKEVNFVRSSGEDGVNQRSVRATLRCVGADTKIGLVGHWNFDSDPIGAMTTAKDEIAPGNDAMACTSGNSTDSNSSDYHSSALGSGISGNPPLIVNDGTRTFIRFNEGSNKNCAVIKDRPEYHDPSGEATISFWTRYRLDDPGTDNRVIFDKGAYSCDLNVDRGDVTRLNPFDTVCSSGLTANPRCDCGHLRFSWHFVARDSFDINNFSFRVENDGSGNHYAMVNDTSKLPVTGAGDRWDDDEWHLVVLSVSAASDKYNLYIDGELHSSFKQNTVYSFDTGFSSGTINGDADGDLEGIVNNDWRIWLGAAYPHSDSNTWAEADMDDLRIYGRALSQCDAEKLYIETQ